ncbi:MAG: oxygen-dependent coproporphyrinogen oxidase [Polyangia bacterium]
MSTQPPTGESPTRPGPGPGPGSDGNQATQAPAADDPIERLARESAADVRRLQDEICAALEALEQAAGSPVRFRRDRWERAGGGGGVSAVLADGAVFEKAGVNVSEVFGQLQPDFAATLPGDGNTFYATGISLVIHPRSPYVPTTHANFRFLRRGRAAWFGGGADLTPYYPFLEDAAHFHRVLKDACDRHDPGYYPRFKAWCDDYFFLKHRGETRGIGGLFFDYLPGGEGASARPASADELARVQAFWRDCGRAFVPAYVPIVERRHKTPYGERQRQFQLYRRGRYVEFNLLYDRGTVFGLKTDGRVESILMSLPPLVRWEYGYQPPPGSEEAELAGFLKPRDWLGEAAPGRSS